ncbi:hypothetical protein NPIL_264701 [Nephila pilipes]|uniref:Uncharacterized protein n=1 Tax=Nephila pilipes TaxID=299642 RepID=A0A8X6U056_NEPPI|nr:hypothetical protein NPIL_264701 [Nephila pilipes]
MYVIVTSSLGAYSVAIKINPVPLQMQFASQSTKRFEARLRNSPPCECQPIAVGRHSGRAVWRERSMSSKAEYGLRRQITELC